METRIVLVGIIVNDRTEISRLNELLSQYQDYIIGRMGLPHHMHGEKEISIISIAMEAPTDKISALSGKIGMLKGISSKVVYAG